jgi:hypothetical protein
VTEVAGAMPLCSHEPLLRASAYTHAGEYCDRSQRMKLGSFGEANPAMKTYMGLPAGMPNRSAGRSAGEMICALVGQGGPTVMMCM